MAEHNETGSAGEKIAADHLKEKGFTILEMNWRFRNLEADIIATKDNRLLVIAEVKTRRTNYFGEPETFVTKQKQQNLRSAANEYISRYDLDMEVRFDIISVLLSKDSMQVNHLEDAFLFSH